MNCKYCTKEIPDSSMFCNYCGKAQERKPVHRKRANGEGSVYWNGYSYTACHSTWRNGSRIRNTQSGFKTKADAKLWLANNTAVKPTAEKMTVGQTHTEWERYHLDNISEKKAQNYKSVWKYFKSIEALYWDELTVAMLQDCVNKSKDSHSTRKVLKTVIGSVESYAVKNGLTTRKLASYIEIPSAVKPDKKAFTDAEIKRVWADYENGNSFAGAVLIMLYTGMRFGEISTIQPKNIHLKDGYMMGGIKTDLGRTGEILIIDKIKPIVRDHMQFKNEYALSSEGFRKKFNQVDGCQGHTPHECRHTTATLLASMNVAPAVISAIMRHTNYQQTLEYTHITREEKLKAMTNL